MEKRWEASQAVSMEPPWPMHSTFSALVRMSAAARMVSGRIRAWVSRMASIWLPASLPARSMTESPDCSSPERQDSSIRAAMAAAMASRKAL